MVDTKDCYSLRQFAEKAQATKEAVRQAIKAKVIEAEKFDKSYYLIPKNQLEIFKSKKRNYPKNIKRKST